MGHPLPWNVYDDNGVLLLRRGFVIDNRRSLNRLVTEGLFYDEQDARWRPAASEAEKPAEVQPSALQYVLDARRIFGSFSQDWAAIQDFPSRMRRIAQLIDRACRSSADVAIASILLLQDQSYAVRHHVDAAIVSNLLARAMSFPEDDVQSVTAAALTMDASMHGIRDKLNDVKGELNDKIRGLIRAHPQQSEQLLRKYGVEDPLWLRCVEQHHEHDDGSGYPQGLTGPDIERGAKIIGLADRYCAQVSKRSYRPTRAPNAVLRELFSESGAKLDPVVADQLIRVVTLFPPGTIVRLRNAEIAIIVAPTIACAVIGSGGAPLAVPSLRETAHEDDYRVQEVLTLDRFDFPIQMSRLWGDAARLG